MAQPYHPTFTKIPSATVWGQLGGDVSATLVQPHFLRTDLGLGGVSCKSLRTAPDHESNALEALDSAFKGNIYEMKSKWKDTGGTRYLLSSMVGTDIELLWC